MSADPRSPAARAASNPQFAEFSARGDARPIGPADHFSIRDGGETDLDALARIAAAREGCDALEARRPFVRLLADVVERGLAQLLVARLGEEIVAFAKTGYFDPPTHAPANIAPAGWYLTGLVVDPGHRRRGIGGRLTRSRLEWISERAPAAYYFANALNRATIELHRRHGFVEMTRSFHFPGVNFAGGVGILFRADLTK